MRRACADVVRTCHEGVFGRGEIDRADVLMTAAQAGAGVFVVRFWREIRLTWCNIKRKECIMNKVTVAIVLGIAVVGATVRADTKTTYRDSMGRIQGTVTTDRYGKTTYRDAMGRIQGTEQTDKYGKTTWRDAQGRIQGTMTTDRYGKTTVRDAQGRIQGTATTDRYGKTTYRDAQGRIQGTKR